MILAVDQDCGNRSCSKSLAQKKQSKSAGSWAWHWTQWTCSASSAFCLIIWRHVKHSPALLGPVSIFDFCCGPALGATSHTCVFFSEPRCWKMECPAQRASGKGGHPFPVMWLWFSEIYAWKKTPYRWLYGAHMHSASPCFPCSRTRSNHFGMAVPAIATGEFSWW